MLAEEVIRVVGTAITSQTTDLSALPFASQRFSRNELAPAAFYAAVDVLEDRATSVSTNAAQNNRLQPDVQYRGFAASPLLGLSQGLVVYQNGVRINEAFGDSVNWDLLPASSMETMDLIGGSNAIYGLNSIGGALVVHTRTGFSSEGGDASYTIGDYNTHDYSLSYGAHQADWGVFIALDKMDEAGWRDFSDSRVDSLYSSLGWRGDDSELDLFLNLGDSRLKGNGTLPVALLASDRSSVFTHVDQTKNQLFMTSLSFRHTFGDRGELSINGFYRDLETHTFNGDGADYEQCGSDVEENNDERGMVDTTEHLFAGYLCKDDGEPAVDIGGEPVSNDYDAINNRSHREQQSTGLTLQWLGHANIGGRDHNYVLGLDWYRGHTQFRSTVEFSQLTSSRGTVLTGRFDRDGNTALNTRVETGSVFVSDSIALTNAISVVLSARYNKTESSGFDPSGQRPALQGDHRFRNVNSGVGVLWQVDDALGVYANVQRSSRVPTPVELACSHPDAPCSLPNSFLADPPLEDVQSTSLELGIRGSAGSFQFYRIGGFWIGADEDIVFQTTGGVSSNRGYFQNAADTVRAGLEFEFAGGGERWNWYLNYTYMEATFESPFTSSSPNNPAADEGKLFVEAGSDIPGLPNHNLKIGTSVRVAEGLSLGVDYRYMDGVYLRGDEANVDGKTDDWSVVDVHAHAELGSGVYVEARLDNAFDEQYETFGLYGEADEVLDEFDDDSGRFLGPAMPRTWWLTLGVRF